VTLTSVRKVDPHEYLPKKAIECSLKKMDELDEGFSRVC